MSAARYELLADLGEGAQGRVVRVRDRERGAVVALKAVPPGARATLVREFARLASLDHPSLPRAYDLGTLAADLGPLAAGTPYYTAEEIAGRSLAASAPLDAIGVWVVAIDVAAALVALHGAGLVHCDVSPGNVMIVGEGAARRAVLLDLGLAGSAGLDGAVRGTPTYLPPEALTGRVHPAGDLYGLGACLVFAARGVAPVAGRGPALWEAIARAPRPALTDAEAPGLADLIAELLALDPSRRPASARAVFERARVARAALPEPVPDRAAPARGRPMLARADAWPSLEPALAAIARRVGEARAGVAGPPLVVHAPPGAGARAVVAHGVRRDQIAAALAGLPELTLAAVALDDAALDGAAAAATGADEQRGRALAERTVRAAAATAAAVVVIDATGDERAAALAAAVDGVVGPAAVFVVIEADAEPITTAPRVAITAVDRDEFAAIVAAWCDRPPPVAWLEALYRTSRGLPTVARATIAALAADGDDPMARDPAEVAATAAALAARIAAGGAAATTVGLILAVTGARLDLEFVAAVAAAHGHDADAVAAACAALDRLGALADDGALRPGVAEALRTAHPARAAELAATAVRRGDGDGGPPARWVMALTCAPRTPAIDRLRLTQAAAQLACGAPARAQALAEAALDAAPPVGAEAALIAARAALVQGGYAAAEALAARAAGEPRLATAAGLVAARAAQRQGDLDRAERLLTALPATAADAAERVGILARLLVARGRYREAVAATAALEPVPATAAGALCAEARATAHLYLGELDLAGVHVATALAIGQATGDDAVRARAMVVRGMLAQAAGDLGGAATLYRDAAAVARHGGDGHCAAVALQNHAAALAERGLHGAALPALATAIAELGALGKVAELAAVEANRAVSLVACGQLDSAEVAATRAAARAAAAGLPVPGFYAALVHGDIARRRGDLAAAAARYRAAWAQAEAAGLPDRAHAQRALAEVAPDAATATAALAAAAALDRDDDDRARTTLSRGRVARAGHADAPLPPLIAALAAVAEAAAAAGRLDRAWRALALAAALGRRAGDAAAGPRAARARAWLDELIAATPDPWRTGLVHDPDALELPAPPRPVDAAPPAAGGAEIARTRRLLGLARRLHADADLERVIDDVIDAALELTGGERAFVLLAEGDGLRVAAARGFVADALAPTAISRSIAQRAIASGEAVITVDAGADDRFDGAASVAALRLRSVMAVPLFERGQVIGCLYVDHRVRASAFDDAAAATLTELAGLAAVAIATVRLVAAARQDAAAIAALNARLAAELADKDAELAVVRAAAPTRPRRPGLEAIVGESPAIVAVLELIERAAQVALPVAITGESGTGKELCARAVHATGPRRDRPFVAINCGAMPEALLESELFGHVRGAFTSADRDRKGLFEVADGGTLFLDEIADTSPAMQAKLLRVVQDGVVRRVGDERTRKVDVRLVTASRAPLAELVATGRFRDDLRYRLDVIGVVMPPLRQRLGDLPALITQLLHRIAGERAPRVGKDAARALARYPWPGNVRELENALARAVALGSDPISVDDLPESVRGGAGAGAPPRLATDGDLALKPAVDALERAYVVAALARVHGNQSAAARLLGLSRFGLQKKLKRLGVEPG
ncbi:MAG: sigma 54-interacting transcriptional regulator [Myxococcales bacterium]|nr:sigma 54-interacting transcriptional regulator [Myxococcales bacterium]MBP6846567.1 sigma 54-interacting transcriptional regulator [Kofleriaceae bacterium]